MSKIRRHPFTYVVESVDGILDLQKKSGKIFPVHRKAKIFKGGDVPAVGEFAEFSFRDQLIGVGTVKGVHFYAGELQVKIKIDAVGNVPT